MYKYLIQPILFQFAAEQVHRMVFTTLKFAFKIPGVAPLCRVAYASRCPEIPKEVFGLRFKNPIGLAAGFDKNAELIPAWEAFGFGFVEIGTITPQPQAGNPKPRLFRLKKDQALINRMGFNNQGLEESIQRLKRQNRSVWIGGNIGKNKITPNESALDDYIKCFEGLFNHVDYFVVNVSSPNTPGLRELQDKEPLQKILESLQAINHSKKKPKPILLKIAPDLSNPQLDEVIEVVIASGISGVIATNTTISRDDLKTTSEEVARMGAGGLSGQPLKQRATEVIRYLKEKGKHAFPVIGVGGIQTAEDALEKLEAGADLVQIYTGFVYEGPGIVKKITRKLKKKGFE